MDPLFDSANVIRNVLQEIGKERMVITDLTEKTADIEEFLEGSDSGAKKQEWNLRPTLAQRQIPLRWISKDLMTFSTLWGTGDLKTRLNQIGERTRAEITTNPWEMNWTAPWSSWENCIRTAGRDHESKDAPVRHVFHKFRGWYGPLQIHGERDQIAL